MCKDFKKNLKENKLVLTVCLIFYIYSLISFIQNVLVALFTFFVVFKVFCFCKKEEKKAEEPKQNANDPIDEGYNFCDLLSKGLSLIEELKKLSSEGNEKANELLKNIKKKGQNLLNNI